ncbi:MAG: hypothetical protein Q7T34_02270, partial [Candidatus Parcubacteria bacterium]|nr:hypothetical protein [Candidatus Parcubacteria bacterium]
LFRTLFSPWRKYNFSYGKGFDIGRYSETLVFNIFSRIIGLLLRIFLIAAGLIIEAGIFLAGFLVLGIWFLHPLILAIALIFSIRQIIL